MSRPEKSKRGFLFRHIGPSTSEQDQMLSLLKVKSIDDLIEQTIPKKIRIDAREIDLSPAVSESMTLGELKKLASKNRMFRSYLGLGYYDTLVPPAILRNLFENPAWYTQYTPYQAEISQGRLESLLNFQTMISDLTGLTVANASVLDEGTAAAEAMSICDAVKNESQDRCFLISDQCFPQTIEVVKTRAQAKGIKVVVADVKAWDFSLGCFAVLLQYPCADGELRDYRNFIEKIKSKDALVILAADLLALTMVTPPGELGADFAVGSAQRFGVPLGFGGPHAGYLATREEFTRRMPGRMIGVSKDKQGRTAYRLALQTREQHIRREKATSNICTAQALLANMAAMYAVYHGPDGLKDIAETIHKKAGFLARVAKKNGYTLVHQYFFDTIALKSKANQLSSVVDFAASEQINLRTTDDGHLVIALDETVCEEDLVDLVYVLMLGQKKKSDIRVELEDELMIPTELQRSSPYLEHAIFNSFHSETELMRYIQRLSAKDLSLTSSMIPLGSCTMKLNSVAELMPVSWPEFSSLHPFVPPEQSQGYLQLFSELERMLCALTGFDAFSLQPNSGAQGEFAGLLAIDAYHKSRGDIRRKVCLIPSSAHGTNPASAALAGMQVVVVACDQNGNVDLNDLKSKAELNKDVLSCLMITYPSTHGVFEEGIQEICEIVHRFGGQVYMDGANMNAQVGLCLPGKFGPDVCHLNLHKTFCIPHGGGGPGMGPIGVKAHLKEFLPSHPNLKHKKSETRAVSAAPWGSASILPISWMYIRMMGAVGLKKASEVAILNANYISKRLSEHFSVLYKGKHGFVAHECIVDLRTIQKNTGITVEDVAKRLMDYGFHAPTIAFPVAGTLMIEPTESESKAEIDRFCEAMIEIRKEIAEVESAKMPKDTNLLKNAPHTATMIASEDWVYPYSRERAVFPLAWVKERKFWPAVSRVDNAFGDRNFMCTCPPLETYQGGDE